LVVDDELQLDEHPELHRLGLPIFLVAELYQIEAMDPVMQQAVVAVRRQIPRSRLANVSTGSVSETIDPITGEVVGWACPHQTAAARYAEANRNRAIRCIDCFLGAHPWWRPRRRRTGPAPVRYQGEGSRSCALHDPKRRQTVLEANRRRRAKLKGKL